MTDIFGKAHSCVCGEVNYYASTGCCVKCGKVRPGVVPAGPAGVCEHQHIRWMKDGSGFECRACGAIFKDTKIAVFPAVDEQDLVPRGVTLTPVEECEHDWRYLKGPNPHKLVECSKCGINTFDRIVMADAGNDPVNHPKHYTSHPSGIECIQVVRHFGFNLGNAIKYIWRADLKNDAVEDLRKAVFYLNDEIAKRNTLTP